jgi:hypothetical protein
MIELSIDKAPPAVATPIGLASEAALQGAAAIGYWLSVIGYAFGYSSMIEFTRPVASLTEASTDLP